MNEKKRLDTASILYVRLSLQLFLCHLITATHMRSTTEEVAMVYQIEKQRLNTCDLSKTRG